MPSIYHLSDNSALWGTTTGLFAADESGDGWPGWATTHKAIGSTFGVGMFIRQPIPTASTSPLHIDGWVQAGPGVWQTGYVQAIDDVKAASGINPCLYLGHASGSASWTPAPTLSSAGSELATAAYKTAFDAAVLPHKQAGGGTSIIMIDAEANVTQDSEAFTNIEALRVEREALGAAVGIESAPDIADTRSYLSEFPVTVTFVSFDNRQLYNSTNPWPNFKSPKFVFTASEWPSWVTTSGSLGGWSSEFHELQIARAIRIIKHGGTAVMNLSPAKTLGYTSIDQYFAAFGRELQPQ